MERAGQGDGEAVYRLCKTYTDRDAAQAAAEAKLGALGRGTGTLSLRLPGRPALSAESPVTLAGFGDGIDGVWILASAEHRLEGGGDRTAIEGERGD